MKQLFTFILFMTCALHLSAQRIHFTDTGNRWTVLSAYPNSDWTRLTYSTMTYRMMDTIVLGEPVKSVTGELGEACCYGLYVQEDTVSNKAFGKILHPGADTFETFTFYDFSMEVGDSIINRDGVVVFCDMVYPAVLIDSQEYRVFNASGTSSFGPGLVIEGVGSIAGLLGPWEGSGEWTIGLSCFTHNGVQVVFSDYFDNDCWVLGVDDVTPDKASVILSPNPATEQINIRLSGNAGLNAPFTIYDVAGKALYKGQVKEQSTIDLSSWPAGMYLLRLSTGKGQAITKKFIKR